jgi:hypothetical protein
MDKAGNLMVTRSSMPFSSSTSNIVVFLIDGPILLSLQAKSKRLIEANPKECFFILLKSKVKAVIIGQ